MRASFTALLAASAAGFVAADSADGEYSTYYTATSTADVYAAQATAQTRSPVTNVKGKAFDRLAVIYLENTNYEMAINDPNLNFLAKKGITLNNYFGVTHPSQPNYAAAIGGDYFGMNNDDYLFIDKNVTTLIDLLEEAGISWAEYQEDMPYTGFEGFSWVNRQSGANDYVRKHNPAMQYNNITSKLGRLEVVKNLTVFQQDLEAGTLPQWMFITPNMTSDGHDSTVTVAGAWTRKFVEPLLNDTRFMQNTLVLITFDENSTYSIKNNILAILLGDAVPANKVGTIDSNFYNHYSEISTVQANWDLPTLGRWDVGANVYDLVAEKTGDKLREYDSDSMARHWYNQSYDGLFNSNPHYAIYPKPNLCLTSPAGRPVSPLVKNVWAGSKAPTYYRDTIEVNDGLNPPAKYGFK